MGSNVHYSTLIFEKNQAFIYKQRMTILSIETSCDDTCVSVLKTKGNNIEILSNIVSSQEKVHKKWGGIYPMMAKREHLKNLVPVLKKALKKSGHLERRKKRLSIETIEKKEQLPLGTEGFLMEYKKPEIDIIAVTKGPGLEPSLWTGINFAKALAIFWEKPLIPVNHIESHILVNLLDKKAEFPAVCLVVSGGHTQLILMKKEGDYEIIGETRDDAAGECFDKTARILGLPYPGGPQIAKCAAMKKGKADFTLPRPMLHSKDYDFSFSGLKTAVLYKVREDKKKTKKYITDMCAEIQQSIIDVLILKTLKAAKEYKTKTIILGGGVTANKELKRQFKEKAKGFTLIYPPMNLSTDNAVMAGVTAYYNYLKKTKVPKVDKIKAEANLKIR